MKTYLTEYVWSGMRIGDDVQAETFEEARRLAAERGRGETVTGELMTPIPLENMNTDRARRILAALSDRNQGTMH